MNVVGLVAADMYDFRRKQPDHLVENVVQERLDLRIGHVVQVARHGLAFAAARRADPRIGQNRGGGVARHFDLRYDPDAPVGRIAHYFADLVLRIVSAFRMQAVPAFGRNIHV